MSDLSSSTINQIKNVSQEKKIKPDTQTEIKTKKMISIESLDKLLKVCSEKKEIKLKYELEKNVNLVGFDKNRIEVSFNDNLDKSFVKDLSIKLFEWTGERWIITFSKEKGELSIKEKEQNKKNGLIKQTKNSEMYKNFLEKFPDANLTDVVLKKEQED